MDVQQDQPIQLDPQVLIGKLTDQIKRQALQIAQLETLVEMQGRTQPPSSEDPATV